jgi:hypothetical protein
MLMAAREYVSVHSQADTEKGDLLRALAMAITADVSALFGAVV